MGKASRLKNLGKTDEQRAKDALEAAKTVEALPEPSQNILEKLVELKLARVVNNKYEYSREFRDAFDNLIKHPPNMTFQLRLAQKLNDELIPLVIARGEFIFKRGKRAYENLVEAYAGFDRFCELNRVECDSKDVPNIIYGLYYLNDHSPDVQT